MVKVLVLGSTGMLGSQVMKTLKEKGHEVIGSTTPHSPHRQPEDGEDWTVDFDAYGDDVVRLIPMLDWSDYVINCIGVIKPFMNKYMQASITERKNKGAKLPEDWKDISLNPKYNALYVPSFFLANVTLKSTYF